MNQNKYLAIFQESLLKLNSIIRHLDSQLGTVSLSEEEIAVLGPQSENEPLAMIGVTNQIKEKDKKDNKKQQPISGNNNRKDNKIEQKEKAKREPKEKKAPQKQDQNSLFDLCDIRVGKVLEGKILEEFNDIYSLLIDIGEKEPRIIGTGLRHNVPLEQITNSKVVVFANLKPKRFGTTFVSNGMIMCAGFKTSDSNEIFELLRPNENANPGDRVYLEGKAGNTEQTPIITGGKFGKAIELFKTDDNANCMFNNIKLQANGANITVATLKNAEIS